MFNIVIGGMVIIFFRIYMVGNVSKRILDSYDLAIVKQSELIEKNSTRSIKHLESIRMLGEGERSQQAVELHRQSDLLLSSIDSLRNILISETDGIPMEQADSMWIGEIRGRDNHNIPTQIMMDFGKGNVLRNRLNKHSDFVKSLFEKQTLMTLEDDLTIDTRDRFDAWEKKSIAWDTYMFNNVPLSVIIGSLYTIQHEVIQVENAALEHILNEMASEQGENLAAVLAEVNAKYEAQAQAKEIALLEKEKQLSDQGRQESAAELETVRSTMIYLILGLLAFFIMIFYIVRSNIARKRLNKEISAQKEEIEQQHDQLEEKNREITDSITYAKRIQSAILPPARLIKEHLASSFVLYKPKDIVAGDFYWMESIEETVYFAAADCTGHGVPGAMVSVICVNGLNRSVREFGLREPGQILDKTRELVIKEFEKSEEEVQDGMDISLCALNTKTNALRWTGAHNPLWIVRKGAAEIEEIKADKQPIGKYNLEKPFTTHSVQLEKGDTLYIFSDGYHDQFGGDRGKKYKSSKFKSFLVELAKKPIGQQHEILDKEFESWRGSLEQIDDVCVIGVEFS
ncbi:MAG: SpoIIE family protein phosphatase [Flavobacteriales bacterium]|nr:SpoIIE family protein phosphatase [Flavobacteriales bacterium]